MPTLRVMPRDTPAERADSLVEVELDEDLSVHAETLEEWVAPLAHWDLTFREGTFFDRANNVEARLLYTGAEHSCTVTFRLDAIDSLHTFEHDLWVTLDENGEGIANGLHLAPTGLDVEFHHIVGSAPGRVNGA